MSRATRISQDPPFHLIFRLPAAAIWGRRPPAGGQVAFVAKLNPSGDLVFSDLLPAIAAQTVAVDATGQIAVSGANVPNAGPYLLELDPTGTKVVFSKTGIGGSALAFDPSGNIYV